MNSYLTKLLTETVGPLLSDEILGYLKRNESCMVQPDYDAIWISMITNGKVISCYYHPKKPHTTTTIGALGEKKSYALPGKWAVSSQKKAIMGNKSFYSTLEE